MAQRVGRDTSQDPQPDAEAPRRTFRRGWLGVVALMLGVLWFAGAHESPGLRFHDALNWLGVHDRVAYSEVVGLAVILIGVVAGVRIYLGEDKRG